MKFWHSKTAKIILQKYRNKSLNAKKKNNNNKELSSVGDRKVSENLCYDGRKSFVTWQIQCRRYGALPLILVK